MVGLTGISFFITYGGNAVNIGQKSKFPNRDQQTRVSAVCLRHVRVRTFLKRVSVSIDI